MNIEQFVKDIKVMNRKQLCEKYNCTTSGITYWKKRLGLGKEDDPYGKHDPINKLSHAEFADIVLNSVNFTEARDKLGLKGSSAGQRIKKRCEDDGIDFSHINLDNPTATKRLRHRDLPDFTDRQKDILLGSMLGDGSLNKVYGKRGQSYFAEGHCVEQKDYLWWKYNELKRYFNREPFEVMRNKIAMREDGVIERLDEKIPFWMATSVQTELFTALEKQWYMRDGKGRYIYNHIGHRIKIVPQDLLLTPMMIAVWYCDDGFVSASGKTVTLCTNGFSHEEVTRLAGSFSTQFAIIANMVTNKRNEPMLRIGAECFGDFFKIIGDCHPPVSCFDYKFDLTEFDPNLRTTFIDKIITEAKSGKQQKVIAEELGTSRSYVCTVLRGKSHSRPALRTDGLNYRNTSGVHGVVKHRNKWTPQIKICGVKFYLGTFDTVEQAQVVRQKAEAMKSAGITDETAYVSMAKEYYAPSDKHFNAKITKDQAEIVVKMLNAGYRPAHIFESTGISRSTIDGISSGRTWKSITGGKVWSHMNTSGFTGVNFHRGKWRAYDKCHHIGYFDTKEEAAKARNEHISTKEVI